MSRIGRKPIPIPKGVNAVVEGKRVKMKGPKGELSLELWPDIEAQVKDGQIYVHRHSDDKKARALHGLARALLSNMATGVAQGFERQLEIVGIGYRAQVQGSKLVLNLGYSKPVEFEAPKGVELATDGPAKIIVRGIDKQQVGLVAAVIRGFRPPEPYKGKGIRYAGEQVVRKAGKTSAAK